jgi:ABC-2 type transport system permease protein
VSQTATSPLQRRSGPSPIGNYVHLVRTLGASEFKLRFAHSALGYVWTFSKPLMLFGVMYLVFAEMLRFGEGIPYYPLILLMGIMLWQFFAEATSGAVTILVSRADLIRKVAFPRSALPVSVVATAVALLAFNIIAFAFFVLIGGVDPRWTWLWLIPLVLELIVLTTGMSLVLSGLFVFLRDVGQLWTVLLQLLFYATPIIYPLELLEQQGVALWVQQLLLCNPIAQIIHDARYALLGPSTQTAEQILGPGLMFIPWAMTLSSVLLGLWIYRRFADRLAEHV